nr:MAG TPA_asm: hypothetical protein [Caudoviricetes sp.]
MCQSGFSNLCLASLPPGILDKASFCILNKLARFTLPLSSITSDILCVLP